MKALLLIISLFLTLSAFAQKQRLEGDDSEFLCKNDSLSAQALKILKNQKVDTIIKILYDYDNGRIEKTTRIIFWKQKNLARVKIISGCDNINRDTTFIVNLDKIVTYILSTQIDDTSVPVKSDNGGSHDTGYFIEIQFPTKNTFFEVRDNALRSPNTNSDTRIVLTKMLIDIIQ